VIKKCRETNRSKKKRIIFIAIELLHVLFSFKPGHLRINPVVVGAVIDIHSLSISKANLDNIFPFVTVVSYVTDSCGRGIVLDDNLNLRSLLLFRR